MHVALVAPEYRFGTGGQGGLAAVTDFCLRAFHDAGWHCEVYSPRMSRRAPESRRVLDPRSWPRSIRVVPRDDGAPGSVVGSHLAELEPVRYLPRRDLDRSLSRADVTLLIAGTPAAGHILRRVERPTAFFVASTATSERSDVQAGRRGLAARAARTVLGVTTRMDSSGARIPDVMITQNSWMRDHCRRLGAERVELCPPAVNAADYTPVEGQRAERHIICVARLADPRKDLLTLVRAYDGARQRGVRLPLVLAGRGRPPVSVLKEVSVLGLDEHVHVRSDVSHEELQELLRSAAVFVSSSLEEGLGLAALEGMACGAPLVATATQGSLEVVGDSDGGRLSPIGNHAALASALVEVLQDDSLRDHMSRAARQRVLDEFDSAVLADRWRRILTSLVVT